VPATPQSHGWENPQNEEKIKKCRRATDIPSIFVSATLKLQFGSRLALHELGRACPGTSCRGRQGAMPSAADSPPSQAGRSGGPLCWGLCQPGRPRDLRPREPSRTPRCPGALGRYPGDGEGGFSSGLSNPQLLFFAAGEALEGIRCRGLCQPTRASAAATGAYKSNLPQRGTKYLHTLSPSSTAIKHPLNAVEQKGLSQIWAVGNVQG